MQITPRVVASIVAGLLAALMYAIAAPYAKHHLAGMPSLVTATTTQLCAAIAILPLLPFTVPEAVPSMTIVFSVLALAFFSTSLAYLLYFRLIRNIGASRTLTVTYLVPVFAMLWGALFIDETITVAMVLGCCLILLGTAIANGLLFSSSSTH